MPIKKILPVSGLIFSLLISACSSVPSQPGAAETHSFSEERQEMAAAEAKAIFDSYYQFQLEHSPILRSQLAMPGQSEWDDLSNAAYDEYIGMLRLFRDRLIAVEENALPPAVKLSYELLLQDIEDTLLFSSYRYHHYLLSQMGGWHTTVPDTLINYHPIRNIQDAHDYIARIRGTRHLFNEVINQIKQAEEQGIVPPEFIFPPVIDAARKVITGEPFNDQGISPVWEDFVSKTEKLPLYESSRKVLRDKARRAMTRYMKPAYESLIRFLENQEKRAPEQQAAADLPDGNEYYQLLLQQYTTTDLTADEIHEIGLQEVARIQQQIRDLAPSLKYPPAMNGQKDTFPLKPFFTWMEDTSERFSRDTQGQKDFVAFQRDKVAAMSMKLLQAFSHIPAAPVVVQAVEPYRQRSAPIAFYEQPPLDGSRPGFYYVNPIRQSDLPRYRLAALAYHEALPGHHLQVALARENNNLEPFRRLMHFSAFSEGWALYAEKLAGEIGGYTSNEERYGQLIMELWRAVRLVVDTGLNAKGWSKEDAIRYRMDNTPFSYTDSKHAIDRYLVIPGQATSYKIGALEIERLRNKAQVTLGERFSLPEFHNQVLKQGAVPLDVLEQNIDDWINQQ